MSTVMYFESSLAYSVRRLLGEQFDTNQATVLGFVLNLALICS